MVQQPMVQGVVQQQPGTGEWADDLFGCFNDFEVCIYTCCCPYCAFGTVMQAGLDKSCCGECCIYCCIDAAVGLGCLYHMCERTEFRKRYGLPEKPCCDCCVACACPLCSICQMGRHTKKMNPGKANCVGM